MNILFLDRNFPGPFGHIATELAESTENTVTFITNTAGKTIENVKTIVYDVTKVADELGHPLSTFIEDAALQGEFAANVAVELQRQGFEPDIVIGSATGASMFIKDVFKNVPYLCYFEKYNTPNDYVFENPEDKLSEDQKIVIKCQNSNILVDLYTCDAGIAPSIEQKNQFPKEFQDKIKVIIDDENILQNYLDYINSLIGKEEQ